MPLVTRQTFAAHDSFRVHMMRRRFALRPIANRSLITDAMRLSRLFQCQRKRLSLTLGETLRVDDITLSKAKVTFGNATCASLTAVEAKLSEDGFAPSSSLAISTMRGNA